MGEILHLHKLTISCCYPYCWHDKEQTQYFSIMKMHLKCKIYYFNSTTCIIETNSALESQLA